MEPDRKGTFPLNEGRLYLVSSTLASIQVLDQTVDTQFAESREVLFHCRKRRPEKARFRDIVKPHN